MFFVVVVVVDVVCFLCDLMKLTVEIFQKHFIYLNKEHFH